MVNIICPAKVWERQRRIALGSNALLIDGTLERSDGATNLLAARLTPLNVTTTGGSRGFR